MKATAAQIAEAIIIRNAMCEGDILRLSSELATILDGLGIETRDIRRGLPESRWLKEDGSREEVTR